MSYTFYKTLHFVGIFMLLLSLGAIAAHRLQGGTKENFKNRKFFSIFHGIGWMFAFVAGFGLMVKAGFSFANGWIYIKIAALLIVGAYPAILYRQDPQSKLPFFGLFATLLIAILAVEYKFV